MLLRALLVLAITVLFATAASALPAQHSSAASSDSIAGDWDAAFEVEGTTTPATFNLKLDGEKITGKVYSEHTGPGTINGLWANNKLSIKMDFASHESIALTGELQDGKLVGEFRTEGFVSKWRATRKAAAATTPTATRTAATPGADSTDNISGAWDASLHSQGTTVPITFKFKLEGEKVTGVSESDHLGSGTLNDGSWKANKLGFAVNGNFGVIVLTGELHDGKLAGAWSLTGKEMKGTWEATKK